MRGVAVVACIASLASLAGPPFGGSGAAAGLAACSGRPRGADPTPLVCPHDSSPAGRECRCAPGLILLEGACVGPRELDSYCGAPALGSASCRAVSCPEGDPIDLTTHACAPASAARAVIARVRPIPDELALGCHEGRALVLRGEDVACVPRAELCPRGAAWDAKAAHCAPAPACGAGQLRDDGGRCIGVVTRVSPRDDGAPVVDVGRWAEAMLGTDGGEATARLCGPLAEHTPELDVGPGGARTLTLSLQLAFPDNDVTQVSGRADTTDTASHQPVLGVGALPAQRALAALLVPLRALGGVSDAASASVRVRCTVHGGGSPYLAPRPAPER